MNNLNIGGNNLKQLLLVLAVSLTGCASMDQAICYGAGTCNTQGLAVSMSTGTARSFTRGGELVQLPSGGYLVIRNQSTGAIMSVIQTSKTK